MRNEAKSNFYFIFLFKSFDLTVKRFLFSVIAITYYINTTNTGVHNCPILMPKKLTLNLCQAACANDTTCSWIVMNSKGCFLINSNFCDTSNMFPQTGSTLGTKRNKALLPVILFLKIIL